MGAARLLRRGTGRGEARVLHPAPAAERHRPAAHGSRVQPDDHGRADALSPDARAEHALAAGHRPRRDRDADRRRAPARGPGNVARAARAREVRRAGLGVEGAVGLDDHRADAPARRLLRLAARVLHDGPEALARRHRDLRAALRGGSHLPRQAAGELGPGAAHRRLRPRGGERGGGRQPLAHHVSLRGGADRRLARAHGRDDPSRDHARRRRGRGEPGRRTLQAPDRRSASSCRSPTASSR